MPCTGTSAMPLPPISANNERPDLCGQCGGQCCKGMPGGVDPADLGAPDVDALERNVLALLRSGKWAVDWWEGDVKPGGRMDSVPFLRPACRNAPGRLRDPSRGGECVLLTDAGCSLAFSDRPRGCRELEPRVGFPKACFPHWSKRDQALAWRPYVRRLWRWVEQVEDERDSLAPTR